jgi:DNA-directed RNA polymerase alpha subunit
VSNVEDVSTIIMNIKKLALKIYSEEDKTLEIDVKDEGLLKIRVKLLQSRCT